MNHQEQNKPKSRHEHNSLHHHSAKLEYHWIVHLEQYNRETHHHSDLQHRNHRSESILQRVSGWKIYQPQQGQETRVRWLSRIAMHNRVQGGRR